MDKISAQTTDSIQLMALNAQFIKNFVTQDAVAHDKILHKNFVCIQGVGTIVFRDEYLKNWATGYSKGGFTSFSYTDESIRIFGNTALVRSRTVFTKIVDGKEVNGSSLYTDTYVKENGKWLCVQAQITPVK